MATTGAVRAAAGDGGGGRGGDDGRGRYGARATHGVLLALSFASGAVDALAVVALGGAFAGVMTGNLIFLGAAAAGKPFEGAWAPAAALCGYVLATALVAPLLRGGSAGGAHPGHWPSRVLVVFAAETAVLAGVAGGWAAAGREPAAVVQYVLVGVLAAATGAPTTFFTSTLTTLVLGLATGRGSASSAWSVGRLLSLVAGAACAVLVRRAAPDWAPALPAAVVATTLLALLVARRVAARG